MKRMKLMSVLLIGFALVTGCTNKTLLTGYNKMQVGETLTGYTIDYRLYGTYQGKNVNDIVRIENRNNKYSVEIMDLEVPGEEVEQEEKDTSIYENGNVYLKGLHKGTKVSKKREEKIGENTYQVYDFVVPKKVIEEIIRYTTVKELKVKSNQKATVYFNQEGYVYRIIYELEKENDLYLNVSFFAFQTK